ncbi:agmatine deiminase family protein [Halalkalibacter akibai]|uniref:Putative agmatine deiminase n=1 Tax=Halalkalibacter akibai (strain ATCC 43226 / DSM 21942 / CIP 109018 / JCM 9157 / 1139) TaxID=1236973 RepID=W4QQY2_HALA3|nr:agmatine deiminase family protein [Halalkalibacter akibai]GAE34500.1 agmatine deiminase [Halalkalibacter akibai JCM 9157]
MYPRELGFKMPAEWTTHQRTFISWPVKESMVYPDDYKIVWDGYTELVQAIAEFEPVTVIANPSDIEELKKLFATDRVDVLPIEHNDAWLRDNGPTFIQNDQGEIAGVNWVFNAWGEKYSPWTLDDQVAPKILEHYNIKQFDAQLVMEGGSFHVDGEGTLLTTEECLLNPNRNPDLTKELIEQYVKDYLNVEKVIWLNKGLSGDETDGHVDNVACFAAPGKVIIQVCHDPSDTNYQITQENLEILRNATDAQGRKLEIIEIEQPPAVYFEDSRLTLSYLNFYFVNGGIILPIFGGTAQETDQKAIDVLQATFPDRKIRTIDGMAIIKEGGNVHCTTQQMIVDQSK